MSELLVERYRDLWCVIRRSRSASRRPPVLCFLHGNGEAAPLPIVEAVTRHGPLAAGASGKSHEFLVVAPQLPMPGDRWLEHAEEVWEMAFDTARRFDGDRRALCLTGFSFGGNGVFDLAAAKPEAWAALWSVDPSRVPRGKTAQPLWLCRDQGEGHMRTAELAYADPVVYDALLNVARSRSDRSGPAAT